MCCPVAGREGTVTVAAAAVPATVAQPAAAPRCHNTSADNATAAQTGALCRRAYRLNPQRLPASALQLPPQRGCVRRCANPRAHVLQRERVCVARAHFVFRLLVRSALTQQRHDGRAASRCGVVQRRPVILLAQRRAAAAQHSGGRGAGCVSTEGLPAGCGVCRCGEAQRRARPRRGAVAQLQPRAVAQSQRPAGRWWGTAHRP
jgi:hypothetical protein